MANRFLSNVNINDEYTLPSADGTADQIIITDGAGQLSFVDQSTIAANSAEVVEVPVKNVHTATILKGTPVYIFGSIGSSGRLEVKPADASVAGSMPALGLLKQDLAVNAEGFCVINGKLRNLITSPIDGVTTNDGDVVYVKAGGGLTTTKPTGSANLIQNMGKVGVSSTSNNGTFVVSSILRSNDVPNLSTGKIWVGDGNTVESTVVHLDETNGRMGIGTTSPSQKLQVVSDSIIIADFTTTGTKGGIKISEADEGGYLSTEANRICLGSAIGVSTNNLTYHMGTNSLGIGTASPSTPLHINADAPTIRLQDATSGDNHYFTGNNGELRVQTSGYMTMRPGNAVSTTFLANGNVGIGTTNPLQKLQVEGRVRINQSADWNGLEIFGFDNQSSDYIKIHIGTTPMARYQSNLAHVFYVNTSRVLDITATNIAFKANASHADDLIEKYGTNNDSYLGYSNTDDKFKIGFGSLGAPTVDSNTQLSLDGSGVYVENNLGIGTTSPSDKLDVYGNIKLVQTQNYIKFANDFVTIKRDTSNNLYFSGYGGFKFYDTLASSERMRIDSSGNVGIGTTSPVNKLHVFNAGYPQMALQSNAGTWQIGVSTGNDLAFRKGTSGSNYPLWLDSSGNVGIGTTSPSEKLEVSGGNIKGDGLIQVENTIDNNIIGKLIIDYNSGNNPTLGSVGGTEIDFKTDLVLRSNKGLYSDTTSSTGLTIGSQRANTPIKFVTSPTTNLTYSEAMRIAGDGNVGIGTTSPGAKLEVAGDLNLYNPSLTSQITFRNITGSNYIKSNGYATHFGLRGNTGNGVFIIEDGLATNQDIRIKPTTSGWDFSSRGVSGVNALLTIDTVLNISNRANVGIGTTSPSAKLEVNGNAKLLDKLEFTENSVNDYIESLSYALKISGNNAINFSVGGSGVINVYGTQIRPQADNNVDLGHSSFGWKTVRAAGNITTTSGSVGIGTLYPSAKLHVAAANPAFILEDTTNPNKCRIQNVDGNLRYEADYNNEFGNSRHIFFVDGSEKLRVNSNGNVGIGTTSPSQKLHVHDGASTNFKITSTSSGTGSLDGLNLAIGNGFSQLWYYENGYFRIATKSAERLRITSNGDVGIGTTSPSQKLEVDGEVLSDGYRLAAMQTAPVARNSTGTLGEIVIDGDYIYVCYATNSWSRVALETSW